MKISLKAAESGADKTGVLYQIVLQDFLNSQFSVPRLDRLISISTRFFAALIYSNSELSPLSDKKAIVVTMKASFKFPSNAPEALFDFYSFGDCS